MKIERLSSLLSSLYNEKSSANSAKQGAKQEITQSNDDAVRISTTSQNSSTEQSREATRAAKVEELSNRVRSGDYKVDTEKVATSLLRDLF